MGNEDHEAPPRKTAPVPATRWRRTLLLSILGLICVSYATLAVLLYVGQPMLIYFPQRPRSNWSTLPTERLTRLDFVTSSGQQTAWYLGDKDTEPQMVWAVFSGNASLGLDWFRRWSTAPLPSDVGFLLIDYPGYGYSEGSPNPGAILEASNGALAALRVHVGLSQTDLEERLGVIGHSLGAATGLQFADQFPVRAIVLYAPFTSTMDMATRMVGPFFNWLLTHRYDNAARLSSIGKRPQPPEVLLIHGDADHVIPVTMGRQLAASFPHFVSYIEVPNGGHDDIIDITFPEVLAFLESHSKEN